MYHKCFTDIFFLLNLTNIKNFSISIHVIFFLLFIRDRVSFVIRSNHQNEEFYSLARFEVPLFGNSLYYRLLWAYVCVCVYNQHN